MATAPNQVWLADLIYIRNGEGWLFLAALIDMHTRKVVGWSVREICTSRLPSRHLTWL